MTRLGAATRRCGGNDFTLEHRHLLSGEEVLSRKQAEADVDRVEMRGGALRAVR
jgi:hypothetical protein